MTNNIAKKKRFPQKKNVVKYKLRAIITSAQSIPRCPQCRAWYRTGLVPCFEVVEDLSLDNTGEEPVHRTGVRDTCRTRYVRANSYPSGPVSASRHCSYVGFRLHFRAGVVHDVSVVLVLVVDHTWRGAKSWMADVGCHRKMTRMEMLQKEMNEGLVAAASRLACVVVNVRTCRRNQCVADWELACVVFRLKVIETWHAAPLKV